MCLLNSLVKKFHEVHYLKKIYFCSKFSSVYSVGARFSYARSREELH